MSFVATMFGQDDRSPLAKLHQELLRKASKSARAEYGDEDVFCRSLSRRIAKMPTDGDGCVTWEDVQGALADMGFRIPSPQKSDHLRPILGFPGDETRASPAELQDALSARSRGNQLTLVLLPQSLSAQKGGLGTDPVVFRFAGRDGNVVAETPSFLPTRAEPALAATRVCIPTPRARGADPVVLHVEVWGAGRRRDRLAAGSLDVSAALPQAGEPAAVEISMKGSSSRKGRTTLLGVAVLAEPGRAPTRTRAKPLPASLRHIREALHARATADTGDTSLTTVVTLICEAFAQFDLDCNGSLSLDEFEQAVRSLPGCERLDEEELAEAFDSFDHGKDDGDGDGEVDEDEFLATMSADDSATQGAVLALRRLVRRASGDDTEFCAGFLAFADRGFFDPPFAPRDDVLAILKDVGLASLSTKHVDALLHLATVGEDLYDVAHVRSLVASLGLDLVEGSFAVVDVAVSASKEAEHEMGEKGYVRTSKLYLPGGGKGYLMALRATSLDFDSFAAFAKERVTDVTVGEAADAALKLRGYKPTRVVGLAKGASLDTGLFVRRGGTDGAPVLDLIPPGDSASQRHLGTLTPLPPLRERGAKSGAAAFLRRPRPSATADATDRTTKRERALARLRRALRESALRSGQSPVEAVEEAAAEKGMSRISLLTLRRMLRDAGASVDAKDLRYLFPGDTDSPAKEHSVKDVCKALEVQSQGFDLLLTALRKAVEAKLPGKPAADVVRDLDTDGSGDVSPTEFAEGMRRLRLKLSAAEVDLLAQSFDQDGNGRIDCDELARAIAPPVAAKPKTSEKQSGDGKRATRADSGGSKGRARDVALRGHRSQRGSGKTLGVADLEGDVELAEALRELVARGPGAGSLSWRRAFEELDPEGTGVIRASDFALALQSMFLATAEEADAIADMVDTSGDSNIDLAEFATFARSMSRSKTEEGEGTEGSEAATQSSALLLTVTAGLHLDADVIRTRISGARHVARRTFYATASAGEGAEDACGFEADALVFALNRGQLEKVVPRVELVAGRMLRAERRIAVASAEPEEVVEEEVTAAGEALQSARTPRRSRRHGSEPILLLRWMVLSGVSDRDNPGEVNSSEELCAALQKVLRGQVRALRTGQDVCRALQLPRRQCGLLEAVSACARALREEGLPVPAKLLVDTVAAHAQSTDQVDTASLARAVLGSGGEHKGGPVAVRSREQAGRPPADARSTAGAELWRVLSRGGVLSRVRAQLREAGAHGPAPTVQADTLRAVVSRVLRQARANRGEDADGAGGEDTVSEKEATALVDKWAKEAGTKGGALPCAGLFDRTSGTATAAKPAGDAKPPQADRSVLDDFAAAVRDPQVRRDVDCALAASDAAGAGQVPAATFRSVLQRACPSLGADTVNEVARAFAAPEDAGLVRYVEALRARADAARGGPSDQAKSRVREWLASTSRSLSSIADTVTSWAVLSDASGRTMSRNALREALEESGLGLAGHEWIALLDSVDPDRTGHLAVARAIDLLRSASSDAKRSSDTRVACHALQRAVFAREDGLERLQEALRRVTGGQDELTRAQLVRCLGEEGVALAPESEDALVAAASSSTVDGGALSAAAVVRLACPDDRDVADMREAVANAVSGHAVRQALHAMDTAGTGVLTVRGVRQMLIAHGAPLSANQLHALASRHRVSGATAPGPGPHTTFMSLLSELGLLTGKNGSESQGADGEGGDPLAPAALSALPWGLFHPLVRRWLEDVSVPEEARRAFARATGPLGTYTHALVAAGEAAPMPVPAAAAAPVAVMHETARVPSSPAKHPVPPPPPPPTKGPGGEVAVDMAPPPPPPPASVSATVGDESAASVRREPRPQPKRGPWRCEVCFYSNDAGSRACDMCDSAREYGPEKSGLPAPTRQSSSPLAAADRSALPTPMSGVQHSHAYGVTGTTGYGGAISHHPGSVLRTPATAARSARSALPSGAHTMGRVSPSRTHRHRPGSRSERIKERSSRREGGHRSRTKHRERSPHRHGRHESRSRRHSSRHRHHRGSGEASEARRTKGRSRGDAYSVAASAWE